MWEETSNWGVNDPIKTRLDVTGSQPAADHTRALHHSM